MGVLGRFYRTYALDFWGFGESGKKQTSFSVQDFTILVGQFVEQLGIPRSPLVGHSMGGTVSLLAAVQYPDRITKVAVVGSPIVGSSLSFLLKLFGRKLVASVIYNNLWIFQAFYRLLAPLYTRDRRWPEMMDRDLSKTTLESFLYSIASLRRTDVRPELSKITIPTMGVYGKRDIVVDPRQWRVLQQGVPHARIEVLSDSGHFPMLDEPEHFADLLKDFLEEDNPN